MNKELCKCGKMARWIYMPGFQDKSSPFFCDDCVHRGCSCNHHYVYMGHEQELQPPDYPTDEDQPFKWIEDGKIWTRVDDKGREHPCVEYDYEEIGFDKE